MRKILVFQHVAHEILGTLNPLLKARGHRVRYINYERDPEARPNIDKYSGLIILGGHMGVYEADRYTHIKVEAELIERALEKHIPILGICLGAQLLAHVLGAPVRKSLQTEIGWQEVQTLASAPSDPLFQHFQRKEVLFQMHGDAFEVPKQCEHLALSEICTGQAFRYRDNAYGIQFHLEVDQPMIERWLHLPHRLPSITKTQRQQLLEKIHLETEKFLPRSLDLSSQVFNSFLDLIGKIEKRQLLGTDHAKPMLVNKKN